MITPRFVMFVTTLSLVATSARAQTNLEERNFPAERFRPATSASGIFDTETALVPAPLTWDLMLWLGYANDPLVLTRTQDGESVAQPLVAHRLGANLIGSVVLLERLQLGVDLPIALYQTAANDVNEIAASASRVTSAGVGNLRLVPKLQLLDERDHGMSIAVLASVLLPTKSASAYFGDAGVGVVPEVALSRRISAVTLAVNVSYLARKKQEVANLVIDDELGYHAAIALDLARWSQKPLTLAATFFGATSAKKPYDRGNQTANEALFGFTYGVTQHIELSSAFGIGLSSGFGTPDFRVLAGLRMRTERQPEAAPTALLPQDRDHDGLLDNVDKCANEPEDKDTYEDEDGCPDLDNDRDGLADVSDKCPNEAETKNQWQDDDGCPDVVPDTDGDGLLDNVDKCPSDAEDADGFEDRDGCPDLDNDADTVLDRMDNCPNEPGDVAFQGCKAKQRVKLTGDKIEIVDKVFFDTGKATIQERSFALLDNVAKVLAEHRELARVRVEGHTDNVGSPTRNKTLSQARADAVCQYLISKGITAERLVATGYGQERPIVSNKTSKNRAINRRVEFVIVDQH